MQILKVEQVTRYLREMFDSNPILRDLWVQGQISNVSRSAQGNYYFTLKEREAQLNCVLFRQPLDQQPVAPANGMAAIVHGRITVYESRGVYQLVADLIQPEGVGKLHLQFEQLKARLNKEGLFDQRRKRKLPAWPHRIGVVTSASGAVFHDIVNVVRRKFPACELLLAPAFVQGEQAAGSVVAGIQALNRSQMVDVIIVARGGGSVEELWPFNDERVARAIFASRVPVVSAIGHETDVTIADMVADVRAPTPSVAAELVVPDLTMARSRIADCRLQLQATAGSRMALFRQRVREFGDALERHSPGARLKHDRERVEAASLALHGHVSHGLALRRERLRAQEGQLILMNPYATLERGYSITYNSAGRVVSSITQVADAEALQIQVHDGRIAAQARGVFSGV